MSCTAHHTIQRRENNGEWSSCVTLEDLAFTSIGYELKAGATQKKTYNLTDVFDISQDGKYRLTTDCSIYDKGARRQKHRVRVMGRVRRYSYW